MRAKIVFFLVILPMLAFPQSVEIERVINELKLALSQADFDLRNSANAPELESAVVKLETSLTKDINGKLKIVVFSIEASGAQETTSSITINLKPAKEGRSVGSSPSFAQKLRELIVETAKGISKSQTGTVPLKVVSVTIVLTFVIEKVGAGGVQFEISPVSVELGASATKKTTHSVELTFVGR